MSTANENTGSSGDVESAAAKRARHELQLVLARLAFLSDRQEMLKHWTDLLIGYRAALTSKSLRDDLLSEAPEEIRAELWTRIEALRALESLKPSKDARGDRVPGYLKRQIVGEPRGVDAATMQEEAKRRLQRRFIAPKLDAQIALLLRKLRFRDAVFWGIGALGGWLLHADPAVIVNTLSSPTMKVVDHEEEPQYQFDAATNQALISDLWISKFMAETLPTLVSRPCYDEMLIPEHVSMTCVNRWRQAVDALIKAQERETDSIVRIAARLDECAACTTAYNNANPSLLPREIGVGCEPPSRAEWVSSDGFDPRGTMNTDTFRPASTLGNGCSANATKARDYEKFIGDLMSRLLRLKEVLDVRPKKCVVSVLVQNEGWATWHPLVGAGPVKNPGSWTMDRSGVKSDLTLTREQQEGLRKETLHGEFKKIEFTHDWPVQAGPVKISPPHDPEIDLVLKEGCSLERK